MKRTGRLLLEEGQQMFCFERTAIPDVIVITPEIHGDNRGYFLETYREAEFESAGIRGPFVQDNESSSAKGVLRGLHFQKNHTQGKLVRVTSGRVFDVAVDVRPDSRTFGQYIGVTLDAESKQMLWIPKGFAHGFLVLSEQAVFTYKCTDVYDPASEGGIPWDDKTIGIDWPELDVPYKTSERDSKHPAFTEQDFSWAKAPAEL